MSKRRRVEPRTLRDHAIDEVSRQLFEYVASDRLDIFSHYIRSIPHDSYDGISYLNRVLHSRYNGTENDIVEKIFDDNNYHFLGFLLGLDNFDPNESLVSSGYNLLHQAIINKDFQAFEILIANRNINPNCTDPLQEGSPLLFAIESLSLERNIADRDYRFLDRLLLHHYTNPNQLGVLDDFRGAPIHYAVCLGLPEVAARIMSHPFADVNIRDQNGLTPLFLAINNGDTASIEALVRDPSMDLNRKCNVDVPDCTPLFYAVSLGNEFVVRELLRTPQRCRVEEKVGGCSPLCEAAGRGYLNIARALLQAGANPHAGTDVHGSSSIIIAAELSNTAMINLLVDFGADVNSRKVDGATPLHHAVIRNNYDTAIRLLELEADIAAVDVNGRTCIDYAKSVGNFSIVERMEQKVAEIAESRRVGGGPRPDVRFAVKGAARSAGQQTRRRGG